MFNGWTCGAGAATTLEEADDPRIEALTMFTAALERALAGARGQRERTIDAHRDHALIDACIAELKALITQTHHLIATARNLDIRERRSLGPCPSGDPPSSVTPISSPLSTS